MKIPFYAQTRICTPLGWMTAASTAHGLAGLWFDGQRHHPGKLDAPFAKESLLFSQLAQELSAYFEGGPGGATGFALPLDPQGTAFQKDVWAQLLLISAGELQSYGAIAKALGRPQAARAVGAAVGRNPISLIVPCHRVVGSQGSLTGYAGGLDRKSALLALEAARMASPAL